MDLRLRMCSWNSQALLASHHSARARAVQKMKQWKQLIGSHDLVATQETHGTEMDVHTLDREGGTHLHLCLQFRIVLLEGYVPLYAKRFWPNSTPTSWCRFSLDECFVFEQMAQKAA